MLIMIYYNWLEAAAAARLVGTKLGRGRRGIVPPLPPPSRQLNYHITKQNGCTRLVDRWDCIHFKSCFHMVFDKYVHVKMVQGEKGSNLWLIK